MQIRTLFPLLLLLISITSCVTTTTETHSITPHYSVTEETLKNQVANVIPAETVTFTSTHTEISDGTEFNTINVEIQAPRLPDNGLSFSRMADEIQKAVENGIGDIEDYKTMTIEVHLTEDDSEVKYNRSYKKEIRL
ncbi:hypothetical protein [Salinimicrobium sp. TH3]|uniref:hypothetical protein n=1 Tax=Salinimicrobium sp. TH3 TaxID=2997342 RepID=UPI002273D833|nr:hypothetical protein [Salinimicrobium sp. TH3]MCY2688669.1 hypothetical protein [Salinimicrobium sp. TH3]